MFLPERLSSKNGFGEGSGDGAGRWEKKPKFEKRRFFFSSMKTQTGLFTTLRGLLLTPPFCRPETFRKPNANLKTFGKSTATEKCSRNPIFPSQRYICRPKTFGKPNANLKTFGKSNATENCGWRRRNVRSHAFCLFVVVCLREKPKTGSTGNKDKCRNSRLALPTK